MIARIFALLLVGLGGCAASKPDEIPLPKDVCTLEVKDPETVSIATLLGNSEKFHGRAVRVIGFYHGSFEHSAIYLAENDFRNRLSPNGLWVSSNVPDNLNDQYILIEGIFSGVDRGHLGLWSGAICNVVRTAPWSRGPN